ncbi:MAG TPA: hypothetical protein VF203_00880 [Burkholderiales bacterium]
MKTKVRVLAAFAAILAAPGAIADAGTCNGSGCSVGPLNVNFSITIPAFVRFQLGEVGSEPNVRFNTGITPANLGNGTPIPADTVQNAGSGATGNRVLYALVSNAGGSDVTISAAGVGTGLTDGGGNTIPYAEIGGSSTGAVALPAAGSQTVVSPTGGVINETGYWEYTFANSTLYPGGTYTGTIQYTATHNP